MRVELVNKKLKVRNNFSLVNYPLHWIKNCEAMEVEGIARLIFNEPYSKLEQWEFSSSDVIRTKGVTVRYGVCAYVNNHISRMSQINSVYNKDSIFLRGIYYSDLGKYGRLGGASTRGVGKEVNKTFLKFKNSTDELVYESVDTRQHLIESKINVVFPFTLHVPAPEVTINHLYGGHIHTIFSLSGPHSGQPLSNRKGLGETSSLGSIWYNKRGYINPRHAGGETFYLDSELRRAENSLGVLAILMQDEPFFTDIFKEKYLYIKEKTKKIVFSAYNWGAYYGSKDPFYNEKRIDVISPFAQYSDLYMNVLYSFTPRRYDFDAVDRPQDTTIHLKKRLEEEKRIIESSYESATGFKYNKPFCTVLQGFGTASRVDIEIPVMPDYDYMRAQIWTAICCDYVGISFFAQGNYSNEVSWLVKREKEAAPLKTEGMFPPLRDKAGRLIQKDLEPWYGMAENFRLISGLEPVLLSNIVHIHGLVSSEKIAYTLREHGDFIYLFMINMFRATESASIFFHFLRGDSWKVVDVLRGGSFSCSGTKSVFFSKFELKIYRIEFFYE